jgi:hypothetical protein
VLTGRQPNRPGKTVADTLWKIASGDDTYQARLRAMFSRPPSVPVRGRPAADLRNFLTEQAFGLVGPT